MLKTTILVFGLMLMSFSVLDANDPVSTIGDGSVTTSCNSGGCSVSVTQNSAGWAMVISCLDGGIPSTYSGSGQYSGTICGGIVPVQP